MGKGVSGCNNNKNSSQLLNIDCARKSLSQQATTAPRGEYYFVHITENGTESQAG